MIDIIYSMKRNRAIHRNIKKMAMKNIYKIGIIYLNSH